MDTYGGVVRFVYGNARQGAAEQQQGFFFVITTNNTSLLYMTQASVSQRTFSLIVDTYVQAILLCMHVL